jgi:sugar transferase (PEP-CTERM system associated)
MIQISAPERESHKIWCSAGQLVLGWRLPMHLSIGAAEARWSNEWVVTELGKNILYPMIRIFGYYVPRVLLLLGLWEALLFFCSLYAGVYLRSGAVGPGYLGLSATIIGINALGFMLILCSSMISMGLYQRGVQERAAGFIVRLALAFLIAAVAIAVIFYAVPAVLVGRGVLGLSMVISFFGVLLTRAAFSRFATVDARKRRVLVLGTGINASRIEELLEEDPGVGFVVVGYVPRNDSKSLVADYKILEKSGYLLDLAIDREVDEIVVALDDRRRRLPVDDILDCKMSGFEVLDLLTFFEKEIACIKIDLLHPSWIIFSSGFRMGVSALYGKRLLDLLLSLTLLVVFAPLMVLVALVSLIESRGRDPIFYHQVRVGHNGALFRLHKFRSMRVDAEADGVARWAAQNDSRITRLGAFLRKTRLDELPQIFNVLGGHMSLVGPRPERPEFVEALSKGIPFYAERHRVKPGVTGWAQMLYPYGASAEDAKRKLEYDLYYVKHAGVFLDLIILLQTVEIVLLGKGAR